eukprot:m.114497 g.114497  ORF g.114497 m.114497 type:complete len:172 (+) comp9279_c2_seq19:4566-5081(+)
MIEVIIERSWLLSLLGYEGLALWPFIFLESDAFITTTNKTDRDSSQLRQLQQHHHAYNLRSRKTGHRPVAEEDPCTGSSQTTTQHSTPIPSSTLNHERIHLCQQFELGIVLFYLLYVLENMFRIWQCGFEEAYENISFEREAFDNEDNLDYLESREAFSFLKYVFSPLEMD